MTGTAQARWRLDFDGHRLEAESDPPRALGTKHRIRLYQDGEQVAEKTTSDNKTKITHGDLTVRARWDWRGELSRCALVRARTDLEIKDAKDVKHLIDGSDELWFTPPEGSRAARRESLARRHPRLYASRHVAAAVAKVLLPLLGLAALIRIPKPDIDLPDIDLPDIPLPSSPWPDIDLPSIPLPDLAPPGWLKAILETAKYWGPVLIAVGIAVQEHQRRKRQRHKAAERAAESQALQNSRPADDQEPEQDRPADPEHGAGEAGPADKDEPGPPAPPARSARPAEDAEAGGDAAENRDAGRAEDGGDGERTGRSRAERG